MDNIDTLARAGRELDGRESLGEFLAKTGLDFTVEKTPAYAASGPIPGVFAVDRIEANGLRAPIPGVSVGTKMRLFQNQAAFSPLDSLVSRDMATYVAGGSFRQGAVVWAYADLGAIFEVNRLDGSQDPISAKLLARNAHDGSANLIWGLSPLRFFCANQLNGMLKHLHFEVRVRHTACGTDQVGQLGGYLADLLATFRQAGVVWQELANVRMNESEFERFARQFLVEVSGVVSVETDQKSQDAREKREKDVADLVGFFKGGKGNTGESAWDGYNGIGEWLEHRNETYRASKWTAAQWQRHAASQAFGEGRNRRSLALRMLVNR